MLYMVYRAAYSNYWYWILESWLGYTWSRWIACRLMIARGATWQDAREQGARELNRALSGLGQKRGCTLDRPFPYRCQPPALIAQSYRNIHAWCILSRFEATNRDIVQYICKSPRTLCSICASKISMGVSIAFVVHRVGGYFAAAFQLVIVAIVAFHLHEELIIPSDRLGMVWWIAMSIANPLSNPDA